MIVRTMQMPVQCVQQTAAVTTRGTLLHVAPGLRTTAACARSVVICHARGKKNFYTVWEGHNKGVYDSWDAVMQCITNYSNPKYMGFPTEEAAWTAYHEGPKASGYGKGNGKRSSAAKYYAVLSGRKPGIYDNWQETSEQVLGYPGAKHESFKSEEQAREWLDNLSGGRFDVEEEEVPELLPAQPGSMMDPNHLHCLESYGAGDAQLAKSGFSAVLYDTVTYEMYYVNMGTMYKKSTKLQSELTAVIDGLRAAKALGVQKLLVKVHYTQSIDVLINRRKLADSPAKPLSDEALQLLSGFHELKVVRLAREPVCAVLGEAAQIMRQLAEGHATEFLDVPYKPDLVKQLVEGTNKAPLPLDVAPMLQKMVQAYGNPTVKPKAGQPPVIARTAYVNPARG